MSLILDGTNGLSDVDGTAATPAIRGTDTNTGIFFPAADTIAFAEGGTEVARFDSSGNLGVGTSSPSTRLDIRNASSTAYNPSTAAFNTILNVVNPTSGASTNALIGFTTESNGEWYMGGVQNSGNTAADFVWASRASGARAERMRITSSGNVGIGTSSPQGGLHISRDNIPARFDATNTTVGNEIIVQFNGLSANNATSSDYYFIGGITGGSDRIYILGNGNLQNINGSYGTISDASLKENIVDATPKLDKVMQMQVRNFNFIGDELKQIGFVAQELETIFPGLIEESQNLDRDGKRTGTARKAVKTTVLIPILVKAMQEQQAMITSLTARIAALENPPVESVTNE